MTLKQSVDAARGIARETTLIDGARWLVSLLTNRHPVRVRLAGRRVTVRPVTPDLEVARSCFSGEFDSLFGALPTLRHGLIIDAGGYIGTVAIAFAEAYPQATILTLEPDARNFAILKRNIRPYPNIVAIQKALSDKSAALPLRDRGTGEWGDTVVPDPADRKATIVAEVECTTLAELVSGRTDQSIDILKMDIEGGEYALLAAADEWLGSTQAVCAELHHRIVPGCIAAWEDRMRGRRNIKLNGEKFCRW